jgi:hypothetical protein
MKVFYFKEFMFNNILQKQQKDYLQLFAPICLLCGVSL